MTSNHYILPVNFIIIIIIGTIKCTVTWTSKKLEEGIKADILLYTVLLELIYLLIYQLHSRDFFLDLTSVICTLKCL